MYLLQRRPEEWRDLQSERKRSQEQRRPAAPIESAPIKTPVEPITTSNKNSKRKSRPEDEIDALFKNAKLDKRVKKAALSESISTPDADPSKVLSSDFATKEEDKGLEQVLGAIRLAPKDGGRPKKKRK